MLGDPDVIRRVVRGLGQVLITAGLVFMLFAAYEIWGRAQQVDDAQARLERQLGHAWTAPDRPGVAPVNGSALTKLFVPRLGKHWVVVEGVTQHDLRLGPGHYPGSALPGEIGNFAVAGHRMPSVFWDLDRVGSGDEVIVETRTTWYVYVVNHVEIVLPTDVGVVAAVPDRPGARPVKAELTLTTCNPKWDNYQRLVLHAELRRAMPVSAGRPVELAG